MRKYKQRLREDDELAEGSLDELIKFKKSIEKATKELVGAKTKERERNCIHCSIWTRVEEFIKKIEGLLK